MSPQLIICADLGQMLDVVYGLVTRGLTFTVESDKDRWIIRLLGGY